MRPLIIDDETRAAVARVRDFAEQEAHWYEPYEGDRRHVPGDDDRHVCMLGTYRCVFSITRVPTGRWRHLSISVPGKFYPNPYAVFTIAELFGFTGWDQKSVHAPKDWLLRVERKPPQHIILAQEINS